jgi:hypothetical protein|tara:strand:+ start:18718 stop:19140 length:423 start_codon:yes stop_codon:yes gene_type:complete
MNIDIIAAVPILLWALNIVVVLGSLLLGFWLRHGTVLADYIQKFKWGYNWDGDGSDWAFQFVIGEGFCGLMVSAIFTALIKEGIALPIILAIGIILALVFIPRWVIDICKGLKMNHKSGDLEKLSELEKQIAELKQKVEK